MQQLKEEMEAFPKEPADVHIEYFTPRGKWYHASWKGDTSKSGGIATNIGIHLFDLVVWLFGAVKDVQTERQTPTESIGIIELQNARVRWHLSIEPEVLPKRQLIINGVTHEFTDGFADLHTVSYRRILEGKGFDTSIVRPSIELVEKIRNTP
ncbi:MAG: Gfo/Idh/MocA family oxidoreductase [Chitinophagales bacterium]